MKKINKFLLFFVILFSFTFSPLYWWTFDNITGWDSAKSPYCTQWECWLKNWIADTKWSLENIEKERPTSVYLQDIIKSAMTYITIIAVLYIIYWGFLMMTSWWDEEKQKKTKTIIVSVTIWIIIMWLAGSIVTWIIGLLA